MAIGIGASDQVIDTFGGTTATTPGVATTASGSVFLVGVLTGVGQTISLVTDNKGNGSYTAIGAAQSFNGAALKLQWFKKEAGTGGAGHTFSVTIGTSDFLTVFAIEITGAGTEDTAVRASSNDLASPFTVTSGTSTQANEALVLLGGTDSVTVSALAESTGFTFRQSVLTGTSDAAGFIATRLVSATGAFTPSVTATGPTEMGLWIIGIKEAGGGGGIIDDDNGWAPMEPQINPLTVSVW